MILFFKHITEGGNINTPLCLTYMQPINSECYYFIDESAKLTHPIYSGCVNNLEENVQKFQAMWIISSFIYKSHFEEHMKYAAEDVAIVMKPIACIPIILISQPVFALIYRKDAGTAENIVRNILPLPLSKFQHTAVSMTIDI